MKANLYKCFLPISWSICNARGVIGLLHPEGVYDDPRGGKLRAEIFKRLKYHFQYTNELTLFSEVDHHLAYSINIFNNSNNKVNFLTIANLFLPQTIDSCFDYMGNEVVGGIKNDENKWYIQGHKNRIVNITYEELNLFATLYDEHGSLALQARLPALHASDLLSVLLKLSQYSQKNEMIQKNIYPTPSTFWNVNNAVPDNQVNIKTTFENIENIILEGPQFFVDRKSVV